MLNFFSEILSSIHLAISDNISLKSEILSFFGVILVIGNMKVCLASEFLTSENVTTSGMEPAK